MVKHKAIELKKQGTVISGIAKKLGVSERSVNRYTKGVSHPNNPASKNLKPDYERLSREKAEIIGYVASEGCCYFCNENYMEYRKDRKKPYRRLRKRCIIEFSNKNNTLLKHFRWLIKHVYGYDVRIRNVGSIRIKQTEIVNDLKRYATYRSSDWKLFNNIIKADKDIKRSFCRAYFDGDGTVDKSRRRIVLDSVNQDGLKQIQLFLKELGIESKVYECETRSKLVIKNIHDFRRKVNFLHPTRRASLIRLTGARGAI